MNLKIQYSIKLGGMAQMVSVRIRRQILAVFMESQFYFTIPLRKRGKFLKLFSQQSVPHRICEYKELRIGGKSHLEGAAFDKTIEPVPSLGLDPWRLLLWDLSQIESKTLRPVKMNINDPKGPIVGSLRSSSSP
jgi:hypothetical protein